MRMFNDKQMAEFIQFVKDEEKSQDKNVEKNRQMLLDRSRFGVQKYGVTTDQNKLTLRQWLQHALEECLDQANYIQAAISVIDEGK